MIIKNSVLLCLFVSMLLMLLYSGDRIYLCMLIILAAVFLFCLLSLLSSMLLLRIKQEVTPVVARKGDGIRYGISLKNMGIFPISYIKVFFSTPLSEYTGGTAPISFSLLPFGKQRVEMNISCPYWGLYRFGIQSIELRDMLGFFTLRLPARRFGSKNGCELTILPQVRSLDGAIYGGVEEASQERSADTAAGEPDAADIRAWTPGDPLGAVHWKLSARHGEFFVRDWDKSARPESYLFINNAVCGEGGLYRLALEDALVECAVSCADAILRAGGKLRCVCYTERRIALGGNGSAAFGEFYQALSRLTFQNEIPLCGILDGELIGAGAPKSIFVVTPLPDAVLAGKLAELAATGHSVYAAIFTDTDESLYGEMLKELISAGVVCAVRSTGDRSWEGLF